MKYQEYCPHQDLVPFIEFFWTLNGRQTSTGSVERIFPDGRTELIIHLGDTFVRHHESGKETVQPSAFVIGQLKSPLILQQGHQVQIVAARFRPYGAFPLIHHPISELSDEEVSINDLWGAWGDEVVARVSDRPTPKMQVCTLQHQLRSRLRWSAEVDPIVRYVTSTVLKQEGNVHAHKLAQDSGLSVRTMQRRFLDHVGLSVRSLAQVVKFQSALRIMDSPANHSMVAAAIDSGYYDQPHFARNFKRYTGLSPRDYVSGSFALSEMFTDTDMSQSYKT
jgi:AraC-like DNA-binding protein